MKIQCVSDLHLEFGGADVIDEMAECDSDVLVLAGDIATHTYIVETLTEIAKTVDKPIVFVPGNHEYYGTSRNKEIKRVKNVFKHDDRINVLDGNVWCYNGTVFVGATGWCDESYAVMRESVRHLMNDFRLITEFKGEDKYRTMNQWGRQDRKFFEKNIKGAGKTVCISHNGPSPQSIAPKYKLMEATGQGMGVMNTCFSNDWEDIILRHQPVLWVHGHTHDRHNYMVGDTPVVCNPRGYYNHEVNPHFDPCRVVEI